MLDNSRGRWEEERGQGLGLPDVHVYSGNELNIHSYAMSSSKSQQSNNIYDK